MEEIEAKFVLSCPQDAESALRMLASRGELHALGGVQIVDHYLDDRRSRVLKSGYVCRFRRESTSVVDEAMFLQLKSAAFSGGAVHQRQEVEQQLVDAVGFPCAVVELPDGEVRAQLSDVSPGRLLSKFGLLTQRDRYRLTTAEGSEFEVCVDRSLISGPKDTVVERFCELEIEMQSGEVEALEALARMLTDAGLRASRFGKFARGAWAAGITRPARPASREPSESVGLLIADQLQRWNTRAAHYGRLAEEGVDSRGVHLLRTNLRRQRCVLKSAEQWLGLPGEHLGNALAQLSRGVGAERDLDAFSEIVEARLSTFAAVDERARLLLLARLQAGRGVAREQTSRALASLPSVVEESSQLATRYIQGKWPSIAEFARTDVLKRLKQLRKNAKKLQAAGQHEQVADEVFHEVRLRAKRLRYALELLAPVYGKEAKGYARITRGLQNAFGAHQDACVAISLLTKVSEEMPSDGPSRDATLLLGRVLQDQYMLARQHREAALRAWRNFDELVSKKDLLKLFA